MPPTQRPLRLEAAILSRMRSEVTSRSNWANDSSTFSVQPGEVVEARRRVEMLGAEQGDLAAARPLYERALAIRDGCLRVASSEAPCRGPSRWRCSRTASENASC